MKNKRWLSSHYTLDSSRWLDWIKHYTIIHYIYCTIYYTLYIIKQHITIYSPRERIYRRMKISIIWYMNISTIGTTKCLKTMHQWFAPRKRVFFEWKILFGAIRRSPPEVCIYGGSTWEVGGGFIMTGTCADKRRHLQRRDVAHFVYFL